MGDRESFSKTDHDATFMWMNENAMKNDQLKDTYNIQFGADAEYVVQISAGLQYTGNTVLIPFFESLHENFNWTYKKVITDFRKEIFL